MFFSVMIPVYNSEAYIDDCVDSVIRQDEKNLEIILVDDGSTDGSLKKCMEWEYRFPDRIKVVSKNNTGSLDTRRVCLKKASGQYLYFMDSDDCLIEETALSMIRKSIEQTDADLVIFNMTQDRQKRTRMFNYEFEDGKLYEGAQRNIIYRELIKGTGLNSLCNKVFSRDLVDWEADYSNCKEVVRATDLYQILPIISHAERIVFLNRVFYYYYTGNFSSISHRFNPMLYQNVCTQHRRLKQFAEGFSLPEDEKQELLNTRFTSDVAKVVLTTAYADQYSKAQKKDFLKTIRDDEMYQNNHNVRNLIWTRKGAIILLDKGLYSLLLIYIWVSGFYNRKKR